MNNRKANIFGVSGQSFSFALVLLLTSVFVPGLAHATSLGAIMANLVAGSSTLPQMAGVASYIIGTYVVMSGIFKMVDHVREPDRTHLMEPLKRFIIGGAFFALPTILGAVQALITGAPLAGLTLTGGSSGNGLDGAFAKFVNDVAPNGTKMVNAFCYVAAIFITTFALNRLLRSTQEGPKGPTGFGTWMMFIVAAALFSAPSLMSALQGTLFGGGLQGYSPLRSNVGLTAQEAGRVTNVSNAVIGFLFFLGWISFIRGIFIIREVSDGGQASLMAGITHLIGGGLAVNVGSFMKAVENTLGI